MSCLLSKGETSCARTVVNILLVLSDVPVVCIHAACDTLLHRCAYREPSQGYNTEFYLFKRTSCAR